MGNAFVTARNHRPDRLHLGMKAFEKGSITLIEAMKRLWDSASDGLAGDGRTEPENLR